MTILVTGATGNIGWIKLGGTVTALLSTLKRTRELLAEGRL